MSLNTYTFATIVIPGEVKTKRLRLILSSLGGAFGIVRCQNRKPQNHEGLPHAFTQFDISTPCANDPLWDEEPVESKQDTRPDLAELKSLRLLHNDQSQKV